MQVVANPYTSITRSNQNGIAVPYAGATTTIYAGTHA